MADVKVILEKSSSMVQPEESRAIIKDILSPVCLSCTTSFELLLYSICPSLKFLKLICIPITNITSIGDVTSIIGVNSISSITSMFDITDIGGITSISGINIMGGITNMGGITIY